MTLTNWTRTCLPALAVVAPLAHHYQVCLRWDHARHATLSAASRPELVGGAPKEFGGDDGCWSPEHLLLASTELCLMATFLSFVHAENLPLGEYTSRADGIVDQTDEGLAFSRIGIDVEIRVPAEHLARAAQLVQKAKTHCIVTNTLKRGVDVRIKLTPSR